MDRSSNGNLKDSFLAQAMMGNSNSSRGGQLSSLLMKSSNVNDAIPNSELLEILKSMNQRKMTGEDQVNMLIAAGLNKPNQLSI